MRALLMLLVLAIGATTIVVPREPDAVAAAKKKKKKKKKSKKSDEPEVAQPKPKPAPKWHNDAAALAAMRAAGYEAPKAIGWEDRAKARAPIVVARATTGADHHVVVMVAAPAYGKGTQPTTAVIAGDAGDEFQIDAAAEIEAEVAATSDPGFAHVTVTFHWDADGWQRTDTLHAYVRATPGTTEIACRFPGAREDGTATSAGKARWVRVREMSGHTPVTIETETEEWGREQAGQHEVSVRRYELPPSGHCAPLDVALADLPHGKVITSVALYKGKRELDGVKKTLAARAAPRVGRCWDEALRDQPTLAGTLVARLVVSRGGTVTSATITKDDTSYGSWSCITDALAGLYFPSAEVDEEPTDGGDDAGTDAPKKPADTGEAQLDVTLTLSAK